MNATPPQASDARQPIMVRPMEVRDAEATAIVWASAWRTAYRGLVPDAVLEGLDVDQSAQRFRDRVAERQRDPRQSITVAEVAGRVVGFCGFGPERRADHDFTGAPGVGEITALYVDPEYWRRGVGAALTVSACAELSRTYDRWVLWVLRDNHQARRFYEGLGFSYDDVAETRVYFDTPMHVVRYVGPRPR